MDDFNLTVRVSNTTIEKAKTLNDGIQGLVNDLGVDQCLAILNRIKKHPTMFLKGIKMMDDPMLSGIIKNFLG